MKAPDKIYLNKRHPEPYWFKDKQVDSDIEYIRKDALISFLEKEKYDLFNWHFQDEARKFKVYEEVINKIKEL